MSSEDACGSTCVKIRLHTLFFLQGSGQSDVNNAPISLDLLKGYIRYCRANCHPKLALDAAKKLENFYVEVRERHRRDGKGRRQIPITVRQLESVVRMAESIAKMSLSQNATCEHVEEAIRLFKISTVASSQSVRLDLTASTTEELEGIKNVETALLQRLPIGGRAAKTTIVRDMRLRGFEPGLIARGLLTLVQRAVLEERGDGTVRRIAAGV